MVPRRPDPDLLLGIDVGTSACKAAVVDASGAERAHGNAPTPWRTAAGGAEIDPDALVSAALRAARAALAAAPAGRLRGIGVASMAETGVLVDGRGRPLAPAIAWHDARGADQARALAEALGAERFTATTGLAVSALCSAVKLRWLADNHAQVRDARRWLNVAEWVVRRLGGEELGELTLASRTGLLELATQRPFDDALGWTGMPAGLLPALAPSGTPAGVAGDALPGARGATLTVAGHDHVVAGVGVGVVAPGDVLDSCGTAEALVRVVAPPLAPEDVVRAVAGGVSVGRHVVRGRLALQGSLWSGLALGEVLGALGVGDDGRATLDAAALALDPSEVPELDLELHGLERTPPRLPPGLAAERVWSGALRAVAREADAVLTHVDAIAGPRRRVVLTGGWARDAALVAAKARLGPVETPRVGEAVARGAALMSGVAGGIYESADALPPLV